MDTLIGTKLGRYEIVAQLGRGGMAAVYKAYQPSLNRHVAIKVLYEHLSRDERFVRRFQREARAAAALQHPNIIHIYDVAQEGPLFYLVMDYIEGPTLAEKLNREGALDLRTALSIFRQIGDALDCAHAQGVIHRDVKPNNILLARDGRAILSDFGIARAAAESQFTSIGTVLGTVEYMSPEQVQGKEIDGRADLYALSIVLYKMLTAQVPFSADTPASVLYKQVHEPPPPPSRANPAIPSAVDRVVLRGLHKDREKRYPSAHEMGEALAQAVSEAPRPVHKRPPVPSLAEPAQRRPVAPGWVLALLGVAVVSVLIFGVVRLASRRGRKATPTSVTVASPMAPATATLAEVLVSMATPTMPPGPTSTLVPTDTPVPPEAGATRTLQPAGIVMVYVPAGEFWMGSADSDSQAYSDEKPQHKVYLDGFWIGRTEVTNAQFRKFIEAGGYSNREYWTAEGWQWKESQGITQPQYWDDKQWNQPDYPVVGVSWHEAAAYAQWAGARLPTEAEWEKAARGTDGRIWPWGNGWDGTRLNFCDKNCAYSWKDASVDDGYACTAPVGHYPSGASPHGALDMAGNVWEWVADWYEEEYYKRFPASNPKGPVSGLFRVMRGGSWFYDRRSARCAYRDRNYPDYRYINVGIRVAE